MARSYAADNATRGFTLIELLVVISIISLLMAILLPALSHAREAARRSVCLSQLRQIYLSQQMYATDGNEYYPGVRNFSWANSFVNSSVNGHTWMPRTTSAFADYFSDRGMFTCPSYVRRENPQWPVMTSDRWTQWRDSTAPMTSYTFFSGFGGSDLGSGLTYENQYGDANRFRGMLFGQFPRRASGFFFNYRRTAQRPVNVVTDRPQRTDSIMVLDFQRPPESIDASDHIRKAYSNHRLGNSVVAAAGANASFANGSSRWIGLQNVWAKPNVADYRYGNSGQAEPSFPVYVDDAIAQAWQ